MKTSRSAVCLGLFALLALLTALLSPRPAWAADQPAILTLLVNHASHGEVTVVLRDGDVLMAEADLASAGVHGARGRTVLVDGRQLLSLTSAAPLTFAVDEVGLTLKVEVPTRMLETTVLRLVPSQPAGMELHREPSAFLNYGLHLAYPFQIVGSLEAGLSIDGNLLSTTATASPTGAVRGLTSFTVDDRPSLRRWVLGDAFVTAGGLGGGVFLGGISVSRSFALDPYFIHTPSLGYSGAATAPAVLDVYVNGVLVKSQVLPPGPFQVQNVTVPSGAGDVRYVVRDIFGRQEAVSSPYYASGAVLAKGLSDYTAAVGATRSGVGTQSFSYGDPGLLLRERYGLTDRLTVGGRLEAALGMVSLGPSLTLVLPLGQIDLEAGASAAAGGSGVAGLVGYTYNSRRFSLGLSLRAVSFSYATLGMAPADDRATAQGNLFASATINRRASVGAQTSLSLDRDHGATFHVSGTATVQLERRLSMVLALGRSLTPGESPSIDASAALTVALDHGVNATLAAQQGLGTRQVSLEANKPLPAGDGFGFRVYGVEGDTPEGLATLQYQGPYGRYLLTGQITPQGPSAVLEAAGSLVWVRGAGVLPARPVQDGFAVISIPDSPGVRGLVNNQEVGRTNGRGELPVVNLLSYYGNRLGIVDVDLPMDRSIDAVEKVIAPPYRGGALVLFTPKRALFVRGSVRVTGPTGDMIPAYGEITVHLPAGDATSPLGAQGEFELSDVGPGDHEASVVHPKGACTFHLIVPASGKIITDVGEQRCEARAP